MIISELRQRYDAHPNTVLFRKLLGNESVRHLYMDGLTASAAPLFASIVTEDSSIPYLFILGDLE